MPKIELSEITVRLFNDNGTDSKGYVIISESGEFSFYNLGHNMVTIEELEAIINEYKKQFGHD